MSEKQAENALLPEMCRFWKPNKYKSIVNSLSDIALNVLVLGIWKLSRTRAPRICESNRGFPQRPENLENGNRS